MVQVCEIDVTPNHYLCPSSSSCIKMEIFAPDFAPTLTKIFLLKEMRAQTIAMTTTITISMIQLLLTTRWHQLSHLHLMPTVGKIMMK